PASGNPPPWRCAFRSCNAPRFRRLSRVRSRASADHLQDVQKRIGQTIRALRLRHKWSQDVFADRSGLNRAHVGEIERGESNVTIQTLKIVADTLGVKIHELIGKL